jgi:hypothetical protein
MDLSQEPVKRVLVMGEMARQVSGALLPLKMRSVLPSCMYMLAVLNDDVVECVLITTDFQEDSLHFSRSFGNVDGGIASITENVRTDGQDFGRHLNGVAMFVLRFGSFS